MLGDLYNDAVRRAKDLGLPTFSAYVVQLIRQDLAARGHLVIQEGTVIVARGGVAQTVGSGTAVFRESDDSASVPVCSQGMRAAAKKKKKG